MSIIWLEWVGYLASFIVLVSLLMTSIIKLRWINFIGSLLFSLYGFLIGALPVGFMNLGIAIINVYYLNKIYKSRDDFKILHINNNNSQYFNYFLEYYKGDITNYPTVITSNLEDFDINFFILRNMIPTGLFLGNNYDEKTLNIKLDFVIPQYRDFKIGSYIFTQMNDFFLQQGYSRFISFSTKKKHIEYLKKMGFEETIENDTPCFIKSINYK